MLEKFETHANKLSNATKEKLAADVKGYEESLFVSASASTLRRRSFSTRETAVGEDEGEEGNAGAGDAVIADVTTGTTAATATHGDTREEDAETTEVAVTEVDEKNGVFAKTEEEGEEEEDVFYEPALVLKTDSGAEVDLTNLTASQVEPEMGGYLRKLQTQLSMLLGGDKKK